jgi:hypothetical protein
MDTFTIREAADACGMTYEAMRARVDRGTLLASKRREDGARIIPKRELERLGLLPGADMAELQKELDRLDRDLKAYRLLSKKAESALGAERRARELVEHAVHKERAEKQSLSLQLRQVEEAQQDMAVKLEQLTNAGFFTRRRLLRELRAKAGT